MKANFFKANTRGHAYHGWLDTWHTFSFADYCNPERTNFGALRVLNDDIVQPTEGFREHPHDNMEIISIPLRGALRHGDSMGNSGVINEGDVQVMSAGTGVVHSEFNANDDKDVNFFQIWVFPNKKNVEPRYEQKKFDYQSHSNKNKLMEIVTPSPSPHALWINQNAWFNIGAFDKLSGFSYKMKNPANGLFVMVIQGSFDLEGHPAGILSRDGLAITEAETVNFTARSEDSRILLMEVPMIW